MRYNIRVLDQGRFTSESPNYSEQYQIYHYFVHVFNKLRGGFKCSLLDSNCPKLQDLTIDFYPVGDIVEPAVQLLRAQSSSYGVVKLQRVRVNMFTGLEMEMEFMKFILASAPVLEEIFIWNCTRSFSFM
uniref:Putative ovule protein n=1 Tax=Solanum chacoense TaxID=4108 RepID=A0A0V0H7H8_SOLCH